MEGEAQLSAKGWLRQARMAAHEVDREATAKTGRAGGNPNFVN
ncbi:hypothetical protein APY03_6490 [Variovorax sp. WDL1]|nr:hypothetical protein APY03_6490 [Variovorax sp. WDL1]